MQKTFSRGEILEVIIFAFSSFLLYNTGTWIVFFLVPLQVVYARRGQGALILCAGIVFTLLLMYCGYAFIFKTGADVLSGPLYALGLVPAFCLLAGIVTLNLAVLGRLRATLRLVIGSLVSGAGTILIYLSGTLIPGFTDTILGIFNGASTQLNAKIAEAGPEASAAFASVRQPGALMKMVLENPQFVYFFMEFLIVAFAWYAGGAAAFRMFPTRRQVQRPRLSAFSLESLYLWPLIAAGSLVVLGLLFPIPIVSMVGWNVGLVVWFLFGVQGLAILKFVFEKHHMPPLLWTLTVLGICMLFLVPDLWVVPVVAVPAFGVSENWIRYRTPWDPEADDLGKE